MPVAEIGNHSVHYADVGRGPVLLLVHGFPIDHGMWAGQLRAFEDRYRVIAPDLPGFGKSPASAETMTMDDFAGVLLGLLDAVAPGERVVAGGLSMGGYVTFALLRRAPERFRGVVLLDTKSAADTQEAAEGRLEMAKKVLGDGPRVVAEAMMPKLFSADTNENRPQVVDQIRNTILSGSSRGMSAAQRGMAERPDSTPLLEKIGVPTLVLCGEDDRISPPAEMRRLADAIPGARFELIPSAGHLSPLENPEAVNAAMGRFLEGLAG